MYCAYFHYIQHQLCRQPPQNWPKFTVYSLQQRLVHEFTFKRRNVSLFFFFVNPQVDELNRLHFFNKILTQTTRQGRPFLQGAPVLTEAFRPRRSGMESGFHMDASVIQLL